MTRKHPPSHSDRCSLAHCNTSLDAQRIRLVLIQIQIITSPFVGHLYRVSRLLLNIYDGFQDQNMFRFSIESKATGLTVPTGSECQEISWNLQFQCTNCEITPSRLPPHCTKIRCLEFFPVGHFLLNIWAIIVVSITYSFCIFSNRNKTHVEWLITPQNHSQWQVLKIIIFLTYFFWSKKLYPSDWSSFEWSNVPAVCLWFNPNLLNLFFRTQNKLQSSRSHFRARHTTQTPRYSTTRWQLSSSG